MLALFLLLHLLASRDFLGGAIHSSTQHQVKARVVSNQSDRALDCPLTVVVAATFCSLRFQSLSTSSSGLPTSSLFNSCGRCSSLAARSCCLEQSMYCAWAAGRPRQDFPGDRGATRRQMLRASCEAIGRELCHVTGGAAQMLERSLCRLVGLALSPTFSTLFLDLFGLSRLVIQSTHFQSFCLCRHTKWSGDMKCL